MKEIFKWIDTQKNRMEALLKEWVEINTGSDNFSGLETFLQNLKEKFSILEGKTQEIPLPARKVVDFEGVIREIPTAKALSIKKREKAKKKIFFCGHMDTVFSEKSPFQTYTKISETIAQGPGSADLKGGLVIMLKALEAFEHTAQAEEIGWEIFLNPDEEIGSPSSNFYLKESAKKYDLGLIYEPSLPDGSHVASRRGSGNYAIICHGKTAHAGRDFILGKNAINALSALILEIEKYRSPTLHINMGIIRGGLASNIVPHLAVCKFNMRGTSAEEMSEVFGKILLDSQNIQSKREGITFEIIEESKRMPKILDRKTARFFEILKKCAEELGESFNLRETGGTCDGNILSAAGLPTLDTLGAIGGNLHTYEEYILLESLISRTKLSFAFLNAIAFSKDFKDGTFF